MCIEIPSYPLNVMLRTKRWNIKTISIADTTTNEDYPFIHRMPRRPHQFYVHMDGQQMTNIIILTVFH